MTETPHADALLTALISGNPQIEAFADLTDEHEREKALYVLLAMLTDPDPILRIQGIRALGTMKDNRAIEMMRDSIFDPDDTTEVFEAKTEALVALVDLDAILPLLLHPRANYKTRKCLMKLNTQDLLRVLSDALYHPDHRTRDQVMFHLENMKYSEAIPLFIQALEDENSDIRSDAARNLIGIAEAVPVLLTHTSDPHPDVMRYVAQALGESGDQQAIPALLPLLDNKDVDVQLRTAVALGKLGHPAGLDVIHAYLTAETDLSDLPRYLSDIIKALKTLHVSVVPLLIGMADNLLEGRVRGRPNALAIIAKNLAQQDDPAALPVLERIFEKGDKLGRMVSQQAIDAIKVLMEDCDD